MHTVTKKTFKQEFNDRSGRHTYRIGKWAVNECQWRLEIAKAKEEFAHSSSGWNDKLTVYTITYWN